MIPLDDARIVLAHYVDDVETARAAALRAVTRNRDLLANALHAAQHDRIPVTIDHLERALNDFDRATDALRDWPHPAPFNR